MNKSDHIDHLLQDLLDGELDEASAARAEEHLEHCVRCRKSLESLRNVVADVRSLPRAVDPPRDLWDGIAARLGDASAPALPCDEAFSAPSAGADAANAKSPADGNDAAMAAVRVEGTGGKGPRPPKDRSGASPGHRRDNRRRVRVRVGVAAAVALAAGALVWLMLRGGGAGWGVESLDGAPRVAQQLMDGQALLRPGEWLETDDASRARLHVGTIGEVDVEPNTRVQLRRSQLNDHRIALVEGRIDARIWAPPRLFFVETPSATAIDLGCAYTLDVDAKGKSVLHVTSGYVELERKGKSSVVPAGSMCYASPDLGPGTVFSENASPALRAALERYDFAGMHEDDLAVVLSEAGPGDAQTLWQLVEQSDADRRMRIYGRLVELVRAPSGVTREGVANGDEEMFQLWRLHLGLDAITWWGYLRERLSFPE